MKSNINNELDNSNVKLSKESDFSHEGHKSANITLNNIIHILYFKIFHLQIDSKRYFKIQKIYIEIFL